MMSSDGESDAPDEAVARETVTNAESTPPSSIEAVRINEVLRVKYYDEAGMTWWWNNPNSGLGDRTPHQLWLSDIEPSPETIEMVKMAADVAPMMGHAT